MIKRKVNICHIFEYEIEALSERNIESGIKQLIADPNLESILSTQLKIKKLSGHSYQGSHTEDDKEEDEE